MVNCGRGRNDIIDVVYTNLFVKVNRKQQKEATLATELETK